MKYESRIAGKSGKLEVNGIRFQYQREDGREFKGDYSLETLEPGLRSILIRGRSYRVTPGIAGEVVVNGRPVAVELFDPRSLRGRKSGAAAHGPLKISAAMPGKIIRVLVSKGDAVEAGQGLVVVEAMKMQNEMKSPKAGRVSEVKTQPGAAVVAGDVLIVVE